jgi:hypothetical protein
MNITPIHCPDSDCYWAAHGIPDQYTEARAWHLAAHRADEHGEPLTDEQIAYATKAGHVIPGTARTTAAAVAALGALPVPVGDTRLAEALAAYEGHPDLGFACCSAHAVADHVPALLADNARLRAEVAELEAEREKLVRWHGEDSKTINRLVDRVERHRARLTALQNDALNMRGSLAPTGSDRKVPFELGETLTPAVDWLINRVAELEAERHSTNEALSDAAEDAARLRDRLAKYEQPVVEGTEKTTAEAAPTDTLPEWLYQRFARYRRHAPTWGQLTENDQSYWEHEAAAVRRAVVRGGFETHVVADDSDDPEHVDDCPGCDAAAKPAGMHHAIRTDPAEEA